MTASLLLAFVAAIGGIVTAAITVILNKQKDVEADWRKLKLTMYQEFIASLAAMTGTDADDHAKKRFNTATNSLYLIASPETLRTLAAYRSEISIGNRALMTLESHNEKLSHLIESVRHDLGDKSYQAQELTLSLWTSGVETHRRSGECLLPLSEPQA